MRKKDWNLRGKYYTMFSDCVQRIWVSAFTAEIRARLSVKKEEIVNGDQI